jgi:ABC-2 type transport system permease protein
MDIMKILKDSYHIMSKDLLGLVRNRMSLAALIVMPIAFLVMFGFIFPGATTSQQHMPVGIVDLDQGQGSSAFISQLETLNKNSSSMNFENFSSVEAAQTQINRGKLYGSFIIPPGFSYNLTHGESANVIVYVDNSNPQIATQIEGIASNTITGLNGMQAENNVMQMSSSTNKTVNAQAVVFPYTPNVKTTIPGQTNYFNFLAPGLMIMIVMMTVMTGIPEAISKEKEMGTFDGMLSAPISQVSIILGKTTALCVRGFAQCILILVLAIIFFGVTIQGSIMLAFFLLVLGIFSFVGIGIVAVSMSGDQASGTMIVNLLMFPMMFLAGIFYPIQQMPWFMQDISKFIPLTYAADAMRKIMLLNANIGDVMFQILILVAFGIVTMAIAVPLFRKSMTR